MAIIPLTDGGYVETRDVEFSYLYWQKFDAARIPVGDEHFIFRPSSTVFTPLPNGGYVVGYIPFRAADMDLLTARSRSMTQ